MKIVTIKWVDLISGIAKTLLWILLFWNLVIGKVDYAMVYAIILIAYGISDIADNTKVKNNE